MVWVMDGKRVWGLQALGEDYGEGVPLFTPKNPSTLTTRPVPRPTTTPPMESPWLNY